MRSLFLATLLLTPITACKAPILDIDPTVQILADGGGELGVSTDYGIVFLGRSAQSGLVEFLAWFGEEDGQRTLVGGARTNQVALSLEDQAQVVHIRGHLGMIGSEGRLVDGQRPFEGEPRAR